MTTANTSTILVNGEPADVIDVRDRGFQYGDGIFETVAVYRGKPLLWERHLARLLRSARRLAIAPPPVDALQADVAQLCSGRQRAVLKIIISRGVGGRGYAVNQATTPTRVSILSPWPDYPVSRATDGVSVRLCETRLGRNTRLAGIKHLNRLEQVLARAEWDTEYADGLMQDDAGNIIEGTITNVFVVKNDVLITPDLATCGVEGVMRATVLDAANRLGIRCEIGQIAERDIEQADEVFLTNSLIGVWPVRQFDGKETRRQYAIGPVTRAIQEAVLDSHCFAQE